MLDLDASRLALERLFRRRPVTDLSQLGRALGTDSRMSIFRRLSTVGYLSSYSHTGRFYTLRTVPQFDAEGLWRFEGIGFSREGTLKGTVQRLVEAADAGRTQHELQLRLGVRVHDPLLQLVECRRLGRERIDSEYVYLAAHKARAAAQVACRRGLGAVPVAAAPGLELEVLLEVIHGARVPPPDATQVAARLAARGVHALVVDVAAVLIRHSLTGKKTAPFRSVRSRR